jgi:hypothetical protein
LRQLYIAGTAEDHRQIHGIAGRTEAEALVGTEAALPPNIANSGETPEVAITFFVSPMA